MKRIISVVLLVFLAGGCVSTSSNDEVISVDKQAPSWVSLHRRQSERLNEQVRIVRVGCFGGFDPLEENFKVDHGQFRDYSEHGGVVVKDEIEEKDGGHSRVRVVQFPSGATILDGYVCQGGEEVRERRLVGVQGTVRMGRYYPE